MHRALINFAAACALLASFVGCAARSINAAPAHSLPAGPPIVLAHLFDTSRPLRTWNGELIRGNIRRDITLWREVTDTTTPGTYTERTVHAVIREREHRGDRSIDRIVHEVYLAFDGQGNVLMSRAVEPRRGLDVHFDPPLIVAPGSLAAGEHAAFSSRARIMDTSDPSITKYEGTARQRVQLRQTPQGPEFRSELTLDLGLPSMRLRSRLVIDATDAARPFAQTEVTDVMVKVGLAPVLREKRELTWAGDDEAAAEQPAP